MESRCELLILLGVFSIFIGACNAAPPTVSTILGSTKIIELPKKECNREIKLTILEIATIAAICLLIVCALLYCVYQYIKFCTRNKSDKRISNSRESSSRWDDDKFDRKRPWEGRSQAGSPDSNRWDGGTVGIGGKGGGGRWAF